MRHGKISKTKKNKWLSRKIITRKKLNLLNNAVLSISSIVANSVQQPDLFPLSPVNFQDFKLENGILRIFDNSNVLFYRKKK